MILPKRLDAIASLIDDDVVVIDVGCDHALLDIYLTISRNNVFCYACDIRKSALNIAIKNINKFKLDNRIEIKCCDGLGNLEINNNTVIVISGMGKSTIMHILNDENIYKAKEIIIQSNNEVDNLRTELVNKGFYIDDEKVSYDRGKYYVIIKFKKGKKKYNKWDLLYGPVIIKNSKDNKDYLDFLMKQISYKYSKMPSEYIKEKKDLNSKIKKIMQLIK